MRTVNLEALTSSLGRIKPGMRLKDIQARVEDARGAINPYTVTANEIILNLKKHLIFPFLEPRIFNPLEGIVRGFYLQRDEGPAKFYRPETKEPMHLDAPEGLTLCIDNNLGNNLNNNLNNNMDNDGLPFFVRNEEFSLDIATRDYAVYDGDSFRNFLKQLVSDMSFLKPILKSRILQYNNKALDESRKLKKGDIVLVDGQRYGKLGIVRDVVKKQYRTGFLSPEGFHAREIGINLDEFSVREHNITGDKSFEEKAEHLNVSWVNNLNRGMFTNRLSIGSAGVLMGHSNYRGEVAELGYVHITGFDTECAIVAPYSFDKDERFPWGDIASLAIPLSETSPRLLLMGSLDEIIAGRDIHSEFFADDKELFSLIDEVTKPAINSPQFQGIISYLEAMRYRKIYNDLVNCPDISDEIVGAQFVRILRDNNLDAIERLAKISQKDVVELARDLLAEDLEHAKWHVRDEEVYRDFVPFLNLIVKATTEFDSAEELFQYACPQINAYQMMRDGTYTLAYIEGVEIGTSPNIIKIIKPEHEWAEGIVPDPEETYREMVSNPNYAESFELNQKWRSFLDKEKLPDPDNVFDEQGRIRKLVSVMYQILRKKHEIRYGRDENDELTSPGLEPVDERFKLYPISTDFQFYFLMEIFKQIGKKVEFKGKFNFFDALDDLVNETDGKIDHDNLHHWGELGSSLINSIKALYDGIQKLTNNPKVRNEIVMGLLGEEPVLLEAYFDLKYLQMATAIMDHFWRDHPSRGKNQYLSRFGWPREVYGSGIGSTFENNFISKLNRIDPYHRALPTNDHDIFLAANLTGISVSLSSELEKRTSLGLYPSPQANLMLTAIVEQSDRVINRIGSGKETADVAGYLG